MNKHTPSSATQAHHTSSEVFKTFENDSQSINIAQLTIENGTDSLKLYGQHDFTFTERGLQELQALAQIVNAGVEKMKACVNLPRSAEIVEPESKPNPFA